jgi:hypothetical protein
MRRKILIGCALAATAGLYVNGNLDEPLSHGYVPLNMHDCAMNLAGETLCGSDLEAVHQMQADSEREAATAETEAEQGR